MVRLAAGRDHQVRREPAEEVRGHRQRPFLPRAPAGLWYALRDIVLFWAEKGVRIFRVDNPHTKPLPFWEWMIREVQTAIPTRSSWRSLYPAEDDEAAGKVGLQPVLSYFTCEIRNWS
jgi:starch synthase (maltosyl-transferring)